MDDIILGIDLGTNSIGIAARNIHLGNDLSEQIFYYSSDIFKAGVGKDNSGEFSYASQRTKARQSRRLYDTRRRKLWATLDLLIEHGLCPLPKEKLNNWKTYDKTKGLFRKYPEDEAFERWISLDFNGDGVADFSSPYRLREVLVTEQLNMSQELNRYMLGRALYHIAQHRGFKSSKGETIKDTDNDQDLAAEMKKSEEKKSNGLTKFMQQHNAVTAGQAFAILEREGERIRNNAEYVAVRSQLRDEIIQIFRFQNDLDETGDLLNRLISTKKGEGTIFYKKPLRSQKGLVGKCTLERNKPRCPICHPAFEEFRAWSFLNNIQYCPNNDGHWQDLSLELKQMLYHELFISRVKSDFTFKEIREKLQQKLGISLFNEGKERNINYRDYQSIGGCPVTARMIKLFGEDWEDYRQTGNKTRSAHTSSKSLEQHKVEYTAWDIWNVCFATDDPEEILEFAQRRLGWDEEKTKLLLRLWSSMSQGYAMLSLKAIRLINAMLKRGLRYNDAVMMAKLPQLVELSENEIDNIIVQFQSTIKPKLFLEKAIIAIANSLIAEHKSLTEPNRFALQDYEYELQESDYRDIEKAVIGNIGESKWSQMDADEQTVILDGVAGYYRDYFHDRKRLFISLPRLDDGFKQWLKDLFPSLTDKKLNRLYHHSNISQYCPQHAGGDREDLRLGSPNVGSIKNPVVMRALHVLKNKINAMLDAGIISTDDTRVVIEMTRELNDANMRWAINRFQEIRKSENKAIRDILQERYPHRLISDQDVDAARYKIEQHEDINSQYASGKKNTFSHDIKKYKLWLEQDCQCMYTGRVINITNLFNDNEFDIEHTIPRSKSFDNSDMNLTICDSHYNRFIKKNILPSQLPNFEKDATIGGKSYSAIRPRLKKWEEMVEHLKQQVEFWKKQSRKAADKDRKDMCVRQRHLWQMELNYWSGKLKRFTMTEVPDGFRNSQLVDTGIITRHAVMYLKSIFNRVEVQKGEVTSVFRKVLGIQTMDEKKNRDLHSHHAIDAIVLTTIPVAAQRDRMLQYFYQIQEMEQEQHDAYHLKTILEQEKNSCVKCKNVQGLVEKVQNTLLVNHISKDQTLTPSRKYKRSRGRQVLSENQKGEKVPILMTGDSVRKKLHKETYVGAIMKPKTQVLNGVISYAHNEDGHFAYEEGQVPIMVSRTSLDIQSFKKFDDLDTIVDIHLRDRIKTVIRERMDKGLKFADALAMDIWPFNSKGEQIKKDKNGRPLRPIRHVRTKYKSGPAFLTFKKALPIKKQVQSTSKDKVHIQDKDYKRFVYVQNDSNYLFLLYEGIEKGKLKRKSRILNYFEFTKWLKECSFANPSINSLFNDHYYNCIQQKGVTYKLTTIIKKGYRVILWESDPNEVADLSSEELSKRLFVIYNFNITSAAHIYLRNHLYSTDDNNLDLVPDKLNCLIEHRDFEIDKLGTIHFYE